jgi:hypothetical protein
LVYDRHYYERERLAWAKTIDNTVLNVLLSAVDSYAVDVIGEHFGARAKAIWGEDYMNCLDEMQTVLQDEWDRRSEPSAEYE